MKIDEMKEEATVPDSSEEEFESDDETLEGNLTEALDMLESCHALMQALADDSLHRRIPPYYYRELLRLTGEAGELLNAYEMGMPEDLNEGAD